MQGFSISIQKPCSPPLATREVLDLAGNAFNGAVCMAILYAILGSAEWQRSQALSLHFQSGAEMESDDDVDCEGHEEGCESEAPERDSPVELSGGDDDNEDLE